MVLHKIKRIWHPEWFHGIKKGNFEGWYYKNVTSSQDFVFSFIPGVAMGLSKISTLKKPHAFLQIIDGTNEKYWYIDYPVDDFKYTKNNFEASIQDNYFSEKFVKFNLDRDDLTLLGELKYSNHFHWPKSFFSPGITGPTAFLPGMQNYHGVVSFNHDIQGEIILNGNKINFSNGKGYIEKDWGKSHPNAWIWMQSNNFSTPNASLSGAVANVPYLKRNLRGFLVFLLYNNKLYSFTSYNRAKITDFQQNDKEFYLELSKKSLQLQINGTMIGGIKMKAMSDEKVHYITESLQSTLNVKLLKKDKVIFEDQGLCSGLEWKGLERLFDY